MKGEAPSSNKNDAPIILGDTDLKASFVCEIQDLKKNAFTVYYILSGGKLFLKDARKYLFSWNEIIRNDNVRLIEFLAQKYRIDRTTTKIEKIDDNRTIRISTGKNILSLKLNNIKTKIVLTINDCKADEFIVRTENGDLNIYEETISTRNVETEKGDIVCLWTDYKTGYQEFYGWLNELVVRHTNYDRASLV